ncbi:hypothetical protein M422DRAFT_266256 [Sphaerobolus stellatus SS14]|uniref:Uncharacterized protein n=1 Tax=Sphaerobolus stellatus (strain SS14) TaxID=990650 RepID=A0A0C9UBK8_SPHS4|nr:hypothetical protein M422DRAFT_266256 [Sphaerobolus stellatus SS14]
MSSKKVSKPISNALSITEPPTDSSVTEPPSEFSSPIPPEHPVGQEINGLKLSPQKLSSPPADPVIQRSSSSASFQLPPSPKQRTVAPWHDESLEAQYGRTSHLSEHNNKSRGCKKVHRLDPDSDKENSPYRAPKRRRTSGLQDDNGHPLKVEKRVVVIERTNFEKEVIKCLLSIDSNLKKLVAE